MLNRKIFRGFFIGWLLVQFIWFLVLFFSKSLYRFDGNFNVLLLITVCHTIAGLLLLSIVKDYVAKLSAAIVFFLCLAFSVAFIVPPIVLSIIMLFFQVIDK